MKKLREYLPFIAVIILLVAGAVAFTRWYDARPGLGPVPVPTEPSQSETENLAGLTMTVEERAGTDFTVLFDNRTETDYEFGWSCGLEKKVDGVWYSLERKEDVAFTSEAYSIPAGETLKWEESVDYFGRTLDAGQYRLLKTVIAPGEPGDRSRFHIIAAEFTVD